MQRIGINTWDINDNNVILALRTLRSAQQQGPVLLHCQHGADRTGLITAMYRILYQSWTKEQALEELTQGGYGYHSMWKNIPDYLRRVDVEKIRQGVNLP
jgi:protein tyrosine/serine phosphatase